MIIYRSRSCSSSPENFGEVLIIFLAVMTGMNLPLTAILLLWINMITDGAPALAFSVDPYGNDIMTRQPKAGKENILPLEKLALIAVLGSIGTGFALSLFSFYGGINGDGEQLRLGQTMVFNFVVLYEVVLVFVIRRDYQVPLFFQLVGVGCCCFFHRCSACSHVYVVA